MATQEELYRNADLKTREAIMTPEERAQFPLQSTAPEGQVEIPPIQQYNADLGAVDGATAKTQSLLETQEVEAEAQAKIKEQEIN